jgi:hypothetical protein
VKPVSRGIDRVCVTFDEPNLVANARLVLVATLVKRLGLEVLIDRTVRLGRGAGGFRPGRKVLTLVHAMVAGASHIDHANVLCAGSTARVLDHRVMAPTTLGTFFVPSPSATSASSKPSSATRSMRPGASALAYNLGGNTAEIALAVAK